MKIIETTIDKIEEYRSNYLNSLPEFQELFIELMVNDSHCYSLQTDNNRIGYVIKSGEGALIEFYLKDQYIPKSKVFFEQIIKELAITDIYCKSFDFLLLSSCLASSFSYSLMGVLYRNHVEVLISKDPEIMRKKSDMSSVGFLQKQESSIQELFETEQQLKHFIQNENVFEFYKNDAFVGCGTVLRTNMNWSYCDLGVWVNPVNRKFGIGSQIILALREFAIENNMIPSCGCAIDNIASQKTIEKSGFVSKHKLINFKQT